MKPKQPFKISMRMTALHRGLRIQVEQTCCINTRTLPRTAVTSRFRGGGSSAHVVSFGRRLPMAPLESKTTPRRSSRPAHCHGQQLRAVKPRCNDSYSSPPNSITCCSPVRRTPTSPPPWLKPHRDAPELSDQVLPQAQHDAHALHIRLRDLRRFANLLYAKKSIPASSLITC